MSKKNSKPGTGIDRLVEHLGQGNKKPKEVKYEYKQLDLSKLIQPSEKPSMAVENTRGPNQNKKSPSPPRVYHSPEEIKTFEKSKINQWKKSEKNSHQRNRDDNHHRNDKSSHRHEHKKDNFHAEDRKDRKSSHHSDSDRAERHGHQHSHHHGQDREHRKHSDHSSHSKFSGRNDCSAKQKVKVHEDGHQE